MFRSVSPVLNTHRGLVTHRGGLTVEDDYPFERHIRRLNSEEGKIFLFNQHYIKSIKAFPIFPYFQCLIVDSDCELKINSPSFRFI